MMKNHINIINSMISEMDMDVINGVRILPTLLAAKEALEKQIPKKPRIDADEWICCPNCDSTFKLFDSFNKRNHYCGNCGQALDWGDTECVRD